MIRQMETDEVKRLTYDQMLAFATFEHRTLTDDLRFHHYDHLMRSNGNYSKRDAKHAGSARPNTGKVDAGRMTDPLRGDMRFPLRTRQYSSDVTIRNMHDPSVCKVVSADHFKPESERKAQSVKVAVIDPNAAKVAALASLKSGVNAGMDID
jgi:hypothetical protein